MKFKAALRFVASVNPSLPIGDLINFAEDLVEQTTKSKYTYEAGSTYTAEDLRLATQYARCSETVMSYLRWDRNASSVSNKITAIKELREILKENGENYSLLLAKMAVEHSSVQDRVNR